MDEFSYPQNLPTPQTPPYRRRQEKFVGQKIILRPPTRRHAAAVRGPGGVAQSRPPRRHHAALPDCPFVDRRPLESARLRQTIRSTRRKPGPLTICFESQVDSVLHPPRRGTAAKAETFKPARPLAGGLARRGDGSTGSSGGEPTGPRLVLARTDDHKALPARGFRVFP